MFNLKGKFGRREFWWTTFRYKKKNYYVFEWIDEHDLELLGDLRPQIHEIKDLIPRLKKYGYDVRMFEESSFLCHGKYSFLWS